MQTLKSTENTAYIAKFLANNLLFLNTLKAKLKSVDLQIYDKIVSGDRFYFIVNADFKYKDEIGRVETGRLSTLEIYAGKLKDFPEQYHLWENLMRPIFDDIENVVVFFRLILEKEININIESCTKKYPEHELKNLKSGL
jgi:hypothetical protein